MEGKNKLKIENTANGEIGIDKTKGALGEIWVYGNRACH